MPGTESEQQRTRYNKLHKQLTKYLQSEELRKKVSSSRTTHRSSTPDLSTLTHTQRTGRPQNFQLCWFDELELVSAKAGEQGGELV
jgi:hypothetical protein